MTLDVVLGCNMILHIIYLAIEMLAFVSRLTDNIADRNIVLLFAFDISVFIE